MSRLILGVLASVAEFERDLIRERTRLGLDQARAAGRR
jgi:putative DNA-invertase from lambdoid prophage Rac